MPSHPLRRIVGDLVAPTRDRYAPVLRRTDAPVAPRTAHPEKYVARGRLDGQTVLLIDDTWTTGASARSAAIALDRAGAAAVAVLVIGRHLHRDYRDNGRRLDELAHPFDWADCAHHAPVRHNASRAPSATV